MPTIGAAVDWLESELFVGRERELAVFGRWLTADSDRPEIVNVCGRGGIGKSALLRAFARTAVRLRKPVILVDSRDFPHTPEGFLGALAGGSREDVQTWLNQTSPVILIDTFEELGELSPYVREQFLSGLDETVKVVIAGRYPLGQLWTESSSWRRIVHPLALGAFSPGNSHEYLIRRGVSESRLIEQIASAAGGNPLALALAADMVLQLGARDLVAAPEWHMVVRSLVNHLLHDIDDAGLRELLECCAVVQRFDEVTLATMSERHNIAAAFDQLCQLSVVRPTEHGLMLHDDVRRALAEDLRWRNVDRYNLLRLRALACYRERMRSAAPAEREWLLMERFYLWENAFVQAMMFADDEPGKVWIEPYRTEDHEEVMHFWSAQTVPTFSKLTGLDTVPNIAEKLPEGEGQFLAEVLHFSALLSYGGTRLHLARDADGRLVGFSMAVPVCQESLGLFFDGHPGLGVVLRAYYRPEEMAALAATAQTTNVFYIIMAAYGEMLPEAVRSVLLRDLHGLFAHGGRYFASVPGPEYKALLEACGFQRVPGARIWPEPIPHSMEGYVLDLTTVGVERWMEAILSGRRLASTLPTATVERELRTVLLSWLDDAVLSGSPLAGDLGLAAGASEAQRAAALRAKVQRTLAKAREDATSAEKEALTALELAYLRKGLGHDQAASQLAVSRSTFYRLLKRGIQRLAQALSQLD